MIRKFAFFIFFLFVAVNTTSIFLIGPYAWDDGAITLAYAKTLAESGRFSLTKASEITEGSSSILFVFFSAIAHRVFSFDFEKFIAFSQISSFVFSVTVVILTYCILLKKISNKNYCMIIATLMGCMPMFTREIMNGMEMTLFSVLILLFIVFYENKSKWIYLIIPLLLLTRFEAIYYIVFSLVAIVFFEKNDRVLIFKYFGFTVFSFLIISTLRYSYFEDFVPNTIHAKMQSPYTPKDGLHRVLFKFYGLLEFVKVYLAFIVGLTLLGLLRKSKEVFLFNIKFWMTLSFFSFALITGSNSGYDGRMILACLPILVLLVVDLAPVKEKIVLQLAGKNSFSFEKDVFLMIVTMGCLTFSFVLNSRLLIANTKMAIIAGYHQGRFPTFFQEALKGQLMATAIYEVTPANYRITGLAVDELREILGLNKIKFLVPDVGGVGLCCEKIQVIDSALLTNSFLAKNGYSKFENLLNSVNPDVIETHGVWSKESRIYELQFFQNNYKPVIFKNNLFWLNKIQFEKVVNLDTPALRLHEENYSLRGVRYADYAIDMDYVKKHFDGKVFFINQNK